ncbi:MAG: hypothetical protein J3R72DRAFT_40776 [Linnemannia gamsii]|nr:MAG: hypothetical protein J3R72DRAFT_40776 [Linnemannia gamsii]
MRPLPPSLLVHSSTTTSKNKATVTVAETASSNNKLDYTRDYSYHEDLRDHRDYRQSTPPKPHTSLRGHGGHVSSAAAATTTAKASSHSNVSFDSIPSAPMEGVISISTATATTTANGHHHHHSYNEDQKYSYNQDHKQLSPSPLGKNGQHKRKALSETANNNNGSYTNGRHSQQDILIHSPSLSPSVTKKSKNAANGSFTFTRFSLPNNDSELDDHHDLEEDDHDHESHSGMDLDSHDHEHHYSSDDKYKSLKRKLKHALEDNEQMSHELDKFYRRVRNLRREKNLLLDRLCTLERHQSLDSGSDSVSSLSSDSESSDSSLSDESHRPTQRTGGAKQGGKGAGNKGGRASGQAAGTTTAKLSGEIAPQHLKKGAPKGGARRSSPSVSATSPTSARSAPKEPKPQAPAAIPSTITNVGSATQKPKRVHQTNKQRPGLAKARKVQIVERNADGSVKLPVTVGIITILSIGHVVYDREAFHNDRYIWPVGYKMSRSYNSMVDPSTHTTYTCSVIEDGEAPKFQIDAEDQPGKPIIAGTATGAWTHIVKAANAIRKRDHSNSASGPDYFGFSNATIAKMIQDLPNAEKCSTYVMQQFEEIAGSGGSTLIGPGSGPGSAGQTSGGGATGKRKGSALASGTKSRKEQNGGGHDTGDVESGVTGGGGGGNHDDDDDDDEEYASLGSLSKPTTTSANVAPSISQKKTKKTKLSTPAVVVPSVRLAGVNDFVPPKPLALSTPEPLSGKEKADDDDGEDTVSEAGSPQSVKQPRKSNGTSSSSSIPHSITVVSGAGSTDHDGIDVDVDVDVNVVDIDDDDEDRMQLRKPQRTLSPVGASGTEAQNIDDGMTTDEDLPQQGP